LRPVRILPFHFRFSVPIAELDHLRRDKGLSLAFASERHCSHLYSYERPPLADTFLTAFRQVGVRTFLPIALNNRVTVWIASKNTMPFFI